MEGNRDEVGRDSSFRHALMPDGLRIEADVERGPRAPADAMLVRQRVTAVGEEFLVPPGAEILLAVSFFWSVELQVSRYTKTRGEERIATLRGDAYSIDRGTWVNDTGEEAVLRVEALDLTSSWYLTPVKGSGGSDYFSFQWGQDNVRLYAVLTAARIDRPSRFYPAETSPDETGSQIGKMEIEVLPGSATTVQVAAANTPLRVRVRASTGAAGYDETAEVDPKAVHSFPVLVPPSAAITVVQLFIQRSDGAGAWRPVKPSGAGHSGLFVILAVNPATVGGGVDAHLGVIYFRTYQQLALLAKHTDDFVQRSAD